MALKTILKTIVAEDDGSGVIFYDSFDGVTPQEQITGKFVGYMVHNLTTQSLGSETLFIVTNNYHQSVQREGLLLTKIISADEFKPVKRQCIDSAGNAIAGAYSEIPILSDGIRYYYDSGTDGDTFDLYLIFDVEPLATYTPKTAT